MISMAFRFILHQEYTLNSVSVFFFFCSISLKTKVDGLEWISRILLFWNVISYDFFDYFLVLYFNLSISSFQIYWFLFEIFSSLSFILISFYYFYVSTKKIERKKLNFVVASFCLLLCPKTKYLSLFSYLFTVHNVSTHFFCSWCFLDGKNTISCTHKFVLWLHFDG